MTTYNNIYLLSLIFIHNSPKWDVSSYFSCEVNSSTTSYFTKRQSILFSKYVWCQCKRIPMNRVVGVQQDI